MLVLDPAKQSKRIHTILCRDPEMFNLENSNYIEKF